MKHNIICFGDSNTHGYDTANDSRFDETKRYPCLLDNYLGNEYMVLEEGLCGRTTCFEDPLFEGLSGLSTITTCLRTHEPVSLLIIMLGTNDVKERFHVNEMNIAKGLERLILKAKATIDAWYDNTPNILIVSPPPIEYGYETALFGNEMGKDCARKSRELTPHYEFIAKQNNCHFLDASTILGIKMHPRDYMHLDENSHHLLAKELAHIIPTLL